MGAPVLAAVAFVRLKREDYRRTKHDSAFSKWKILIGPSDWEDHWLGKEGAERYRIQNLPVTPGPGVYEIGVAVWLTGSGREVGKLDPDRIVVVYLGQAENVRSRLQSYGRGGAHLEKESNRSNRSNGYSSMELTDCGSGLFKEIFGRGLPIVYRWASMNSKRDAERTEAELLARFDYAWNKVGNGTKRPGDVLLKIYEMSSKATFPVPKLMRMLNFPTQKRVGIPIKPSKPSLPDKTCNDYAEHNYLGLLARVFKFGRSQPRTVISLDGDTPDLAEYHNLNASNICGITLADGFICRNQAVEGRKRCPEHKGKKKGTANGVNLNSSCNGTSTCKLNVQDHSFDDKRTVDDVDVELFSPICGFILLNGSPCTKKPVTGRKRCHEHKGKRIQHLSTPKISYQEPSSFDIVNQATLDQESISTKHSAIVNDTNCCGVVLSCGSYCKRQPINGRKRCEEHKGMRIRRCLSTRVAAHTEEFSSEKWAPDHLALSV